MSIIVPASSHTGIGAWVNSKMYTSVLYNIINYTMQQVYRTNRVINTKNYIKQHIPRGKSESTNNGQISQGKPSSPEWSINSR